MSRLSRLVEELAPNGVEHLGLGDVGEFVRGTGIQKKDLLDSGVSCIHYGQIFTHYGAWATMTKSFISEAMATRARMAHPGDLVIATTSENDEDVCKAVAWLGQNDAAVSSDAMIYRHRLEPKYVAYFFQTAAFQSQKRPFISGTKVKRVSSGDLGKIRIPVPPPEVQREIVKVLDQFTELAADLAAELAARRVQYAYYRDRLLSFGDSDSLSLSRRTSQVDDIG